MVLLEAWGDVKWRAKMEIELGLKFGSKLSPWQWHEDKWNEKKVGPLPVAALAGLTVTITIPIPNASKSPPYPEPLNFPIPFSF